MKNIYNLFFTCIMFLKLLPVSAQDPNFHIYLCFGQSNMAGAGDIETQDKTVDSRFQFMKPQDCPAKNQYSGNWYSAIPPLWGCTGGLGPSDYFGRTMVANLPSNVKVGVVVVGVPGCKIELFGKTGYQGYDTYNYVPAKYSGSAYAWLLDLAKKAQTAGVIKGILLHQGESNNGDQAWPGKVKGVYDNLVKDLNLDASRTPLLAGELLYQNQGGVCWGHNSIIAKLPSTLPNSYVISANGLPGKDEFHFTSAGNRTFGERYAQKMLSLQPKGTPPSVSLTAPSVNSSYTTLQIINIAASASDPDGTVSKVEFYDGNTLLFSDNAAPYSYAWSGATAGAHTITARATDNAGQMTTSASVTITVNAEQAPFKGTAHSIPGRIEAEEYDLGGEGVAYHEANTSGNEGKADLRSDQVDIETTADKNGSYNVGYILKGEWLEYTVNVSATGPYNFYLRVAANGDGKVMHIEIDGADVTGPVAVPNTAGWQSWTTVNAGNINLTQGIHIMRLAFDADYMNINYMELGNVITGVSENHNNGIKLSPNPFDDEGFVIQNGVKFNYRITDMSGIVAEQGEGKEGQIAGKDLIPGLYLFYVEEETGTSVYKIIKQ
jgi:hypothetical protein